MSICDGCIHDYVCGLEDNHEEGIVSCADMIPKDVFEDIKTEIKVVQEDIMYKYEADFRYGVDTVLKIIDKHISGEKQRKE